jgi:hypothetical protein
MIESVSGRVFQAPVPAAESNTGTADACTGTAARTRFCLDLMKIKKATPQLYDFLRVRSFTNQTNDSGSEEAVITQIDDDVGRKGLSSHDLLLQIHGLDFFFFPLSFKDVTAEMIPS